jgi:hypothetical protein
MAVHRFAINVPNPAPRAVVVDLQLEPLSRVPRAGLTAPAGKLRVERAGLALDPCASQVDKTLRVTLPPFSSVTVTAVVVTAPKGKGAAAFHVVDRRNKRDAGGVTLACIEPMPRDSRGQSVPAAKPCEVVLAGTPYMVEPDADPGRRAASARLIPGAQCDFVVPLINPVDRPLDHVVAYLEHLGGSDADFAPVIWNIGTMAPKQIFYATWRLRASGGRRGSFDAAIVVESSGKNPTRLRAPFSVAGKSEPAPTSPRRISSARPRQSRRTSPGPAPTPSASARRARR